MLYEVITHFVAPLCDVDRQQFGKRGRVEIEAFGLQVLGTRQEADRGFPGARAMLATFDDVITS